MQKLLDRFSLHYLIVGLIIAIPVYPKFPLFSVPGTFVSVRLEDFILLVTFLVLIVKSLPKVGLLLKDRSLAALLIFLLVSGLSLASGIFITQTVSIHIGILHWLRRLEYFTPFLLGLVTKHDKAHLKLYLACFVFVLGYVFLYGFLQKHANLPIVTTQNQEYSKGVALRYTPGGHINSTFAGHYDLASFLILVVPLFYTTFFCFKDKLSKLALALAVLASLWLLVNSVSRISIVSYLFATIIALVLIKKFKAIFVAVVVSIVFIAFSSNLLARYSAIFEVMLDKIVSRVVVLADGGETQPVVEERSTSIRLNVEWPRAIRAFVKNPLLGTGFSSITLATDNDYLRLLGETGLVGLVAFVTILLTLVRLILSRVAKPINFGLNTAWAAAFSGSFFGICLNAVFIDVFESSKFAILFWLMAGIFVSLSRSKNLDAKN